MLLQLSRSRLVQLWTIITFVCISTINGQNPAVCGDGGAAQVMDPKWHTVPQRFEIVTELVDTADRKAAEVSQAFSSRRDALIYNAGGQVHFYWNYDTNEQFQVLSFVINNQIVTQCFREELIPGTTQTSVITPNTLYLKPSVLLGFTPTNERNPNWKVKYINDTTLRGIPVNTFTACFDIPDIQATALVTYQASDADKFLAYLMRNQSIVMEMDVFVQKNTGQTARYKYNVFRYIPNPGRREERQALETPSGVYCLNRTSTLALPTNIPERVSSNVETVVPQLNMSIFSGHNLYDTFFQVSRFEFWFPESRRGRNFGHISEVHDFATGLRYRYDHVTRRCNVTDIGMNGPDAVAVDGQPNLVQMGDPAHAFLMDDIEYQYTGEKRCRDRVWCHVWIGEKATPDNKGFEHREWYWASNVNGEPLQPWVPMKLVLNRLDNNRTLLGTADFHFYNYRRNPLTIFEVDFTMAECYRALGPEEKYNLGVISFTVANDKKYPVIENLSYLQFSIWQTLTFSLGVRPSRISNIIVDERANHSDIIVTLTLLDAPPRLGPVEDPIQETSLIKLIDRLGGLIDSNDLAFRAKQKNREVKLRARPNSLNVIHTSLDQRYRTTGPTITGLWIGLLVVGLLLGAVGGFFAFRALAK